MARCSIGRRDDILCELRSAIIAGDFAPGEFLPIRAELETQYEAGPMTIQWAFAELLKEGFVMARRGVGTQVVDHPPHVCQYGLVFPQRPGVRRRRWSQFWAALELSADQISRDQTPTKFKLFFEIDGHIDNQDYISLCEDVEHQRLAGVIFANPPYALESHDLIKQTRVPMVAVDSGNGVGAVRALQTSIESEHRAIAEHLAEVGCRRVAMVGYTYPTRDLEATVIKRLANVGVALPERWCIRCGLDLVEAAQDITRHLFSSSARERPDGLIVADDNFTDHAIAGVLETGCRIPQDVRVVSRWNFPRRAPRDAPFSRVGPDAVAILEQAVKLCKDSAANPKDRTPRRVDVCHLDIRSPERISKSAAH